MIKLFYFIEGNHYIKYKINLILIQYDYNINVLIKLLKIKKDKEWKYQEVIFFYQQ